MREFKHFSYHTEYSCTGTFRKEINRTACFADVFRSVNSRSDIIYNVQFYKGTKFQKTTGGGNACIVTKKQVIRLLNTLNRIYHFFFKVEEYEDKGYEKYRVVMRIKGVPATFHKFVLSNLRCVYEFPHNLLLYDAFLLKERSPFKKENIFNLLNLTLSCSYDELHGEHLMIEGRYIHLNETIMNLRKKIKKATLVHDIYTQVKRKTCSIPFKIPADEDTSYTVRDLEYWTTGFLKRLPVYEKAYSDKRIAIKRYLNE